MPLYLHRSHRMELLAERFVDLVDASGGDVFESPYLVVQGQGMERWLAQFGARTHGVFAGVRVIRVRSLVKLVCDALLSDDPAKELEPDTLVFRVLAELDGVLASDDGAAFQRYLSARDDPERRAQLAERLADALDRYSVHRPALLESWAKKTHALTDEPMVRAQAELFRRIIARAPVYESKRVHTAIARLDRAAPLLLRALPKRIHVFGVATLAPLYLDLFRKVAGATEVHLYVLCPGTEWLSDLSHEESGRGEVGSLIRGFGKLAAEFQSLLEEAGVAETDYLGDDEPAPRTMLGVLQHDLRTLTQRGVGPSRLPPVRVANDDRSFVVHACHSQRREIEALRDVVVDLLERDPTLEPQDIAVLAADIESYAPLVHAVFERDEGAADAVPYHVADRGARALSPVVDAFFAIFDAFDARATLPSMADLLARVPVATKFELEVDDVERVVRWLRDAGARWGLDAADRLAEDQLALSEHTFERALDRLALGFATGNEDARLGQLVAHDVPGGKDAVALGGLFAFFDAFGSLRRRVATATDVPKLTAVAYAVLASMIATDGTFEDEAIRIRTAVARIQSLASEAHFAGAFSKDAFVRALTRELDAAGGSGGFLRGGITFCRQVPMRAIPFRVLCLLGLDDESYPRNVEAPKFDLIARDPQRGDRTPRDDDRQAFLDALLSARDAIHLFHVGRDLTTDRERPVSTVVTRTLDVLHRSVAREDEGKVTDLTWVNHPLHAFDPKHFEADAASHGLASREAEAFLAAQATLAPSGVPVVELVLDDAPTVESVTLDELLAFLRDPDKDFVRNVLGAEPNFAEASLPDRETLDASGLDGYALKELAIERVLAGDDDEAIRVLARARALLPPGTLGTVAIDEGIAFAREVQAHARMGAPREPVPFELPLGAVKLVGILDGLYERGALYITPSTMKPHHKFAGFVRQLVLERVAPPGVASATRIVATHKGSSPATPEVFDAVVPAKVDPEAALATLVSAYVAGRREPTLVDASLLGAFAKAGKDKHPLGAALAKLTKSMRPSDETYQGQDGSSAARTTLFASAFAPRATPTTELLGASFREVAESVFAPFLPSTKEASE